jgi:SPP1 family predicted phage head-tail adaptor
MQRHTTAGRMDQEVAIQRMTRTSDGAGGYTETWATLSTVWAHVGPKAGREHLADGRINASYVNVFTLYYQDGLQEADRIVWGGENWNIRGIRRAGGRELTMQIEAERGVAQ